MNGTGPAPARSRRTDEPLLLDAGEHAIRYVRTVQRGHDPKCVAPWRRSSLVASTSSPTPRQIA